MSTPLVEVSNLTRHFGDVRAVDGLSFAIHAGQVVGFIGANGSGKTTTMRIMATLDTPSGGSVRIGGHDALNFPNEVRRIIGWMPDAYGTYDNMTVLEYLDFFARAFGFRRTERKQRVEEVMEFANLTSLADRPMNKLSKGMAQRLCLGRTLLHDPPLLILDEPAAGLDPQARVEFKHLVRILAEEGKTLFISSHILSELGEMCDTMIFIDKGKLVHHGSSESLRRGGEETAVQVEVRVTGELHVLMEWVALNPRVELLEATRQGARIRVEEGSEAVLASVLKKMIADGVAVHNFHRMERQLEQAFVEILKGTPSTPSPPSKSVNTGNTGNTGSPPEPPPTNLKSQI